MDFFEAARSRRSARDFTSAAVREAQVSAAQIPMVRAGSAEIRVIAGLLEGIRGPVTDIAADPLYVDVRLAPGAGLQHSVDPRRTVCAYIFEGEGTMGAISSPSGNPIAAPSLVVLGDGDTLSVQAGPSGLRFMLFAGLPLREPIARYGPFVMNTQEEIEQALADLHEGTFVRARPGGPVRVR